MEVIPAINCHLKDFDCVEQKVRAAEKIAKWVHLDVADGKFTYNKTWGDFKEWEKIGTTLNLEVHLMVEEPEKVAEDWLKAGAKRLIVHFETLNEETAKELIRLTRHYGAGIMLALNPETRIEDLSPFFRSFAEYQVLTVHPGLPAQKPLHLMFEKIGELRKEVRSARIEVDGGITPATAKKAREEGADAIVSGSYIFHSGDHVEAMEELKNA